MGFGKKIAYLLAGLVAVWLGGSLLAKTPEYEVHYYRETPFRFCAGGGHCSINYRVIVGNTGKRDLSQVEVAFLSEIYDRIERELVARSQLTVVREVKKKRQSNFTTFYLGEIKTGGVVGLEFVVGLDRSEGEPHWDRVLHSVKPEKGQALNGDPRMIRFGRFLFTFLKMI